MNLDKKTIAIIGLGYVGLPLAIEFGKIRNVIGFDASQERVDELTQGIDSTQEVSATDFKEARGLVIASDSGELKNAQIFIVTVPTPVDKTKRPDLTPLINASEIVGKVLKPGDVVIYESTVYPGATEEICVPILVKNSSLQYIQQDDEDTSNASHSNAGSGGFYCGYSPERINPGDKTHRLTNIIKVTSGSTPRVADAIDNLYKSIIKAGTHKASSIKVAEAAKVIENTQRDLNIALMNELSIIFHKMNIDTLEVLKAAGTKWNFLPFTPGLVGGHCIGVDPYYLTYKAQELDYQPEVILAGRRINDRMAEYLAKRVIKLMLKNRITVLNSRVLVLGLSFKENCPDLRNSKVIDFIGQMEDFGAIIDVYDPWISADEAMQRYGIRCLKELPKAGGYDAIILAVAHQILVDYGYEAIRGFGSENAIFFDVKGCYPKSLSDGRL